jgi:hypothetical protein
MIKKTEGGRVLHFRVVTSYLSISRSGLNSMLLDPWLSKWFVVLLSFPLLARRYLPRTR